MTQLDTYHVTWTTHKGDGINPARQVMEEFNGVSQWWGPRAEPVPEVWDTCLAGVQMTQKAEWLTKNGIDHSIHLHTTHEGALQCVTS